MMEPNTPIRVLLADPHGLCRDGLTRILEPEPDLQVVGAADNGSGTVMLALTLHPSVVVLALDLPDEDLDGVIRLIRSRSPGSKILVLASRGDADSVQCALKAGAHGYLSKDVSGAEFVAALRNLEHHAKRVFVSVSLEVLARHGEQPAGPLTPREAEILTLAAEALTNVQIAGVLGIAESTVKRHLTNAYSRLSAASRIDAINKAMAGGIIRGMVNGRRPSFP